MKKRTKKRSGLLNFLLVPALSLTLAQTSLAGEHFDSDGHQNTGKETTPKCYRISDYLAGDFHQHTTYTDGSYSYDYMMEKNKEFGLGWWTQSEHGGGFNRDGRHGIDNGGDVYWDSYQPNPIIGDVKTSGGHQLMWRWQSLRDYLVQDVLKARADYPDKMILQGFEWNMPGHEHCSVALITGQFDKYNPNTKALAEFEYKFDNSDADISGGAAQGWVKSALTKHAKAVEAVAWLQANHPGASYTVPAHVERKGTYATGGYDINHFRDLNNAGPDVCFGFEGLPGHQVNSDRGGFGSGAFGGGTYGGAGYYIAKVGGLWDALLGEGRHWWNFASSDCHLHWIDGGDDFWPGEYQKTYVYVKDSNKPREYINGLRSGNSFVVNGDLINELDFTIAARNESENAATMGQELVLKKNKKKHKNNNADGVTIVIRFKSPETNNNGDAVNVDHIDLIAGEVTGKIDPSSPAYTKATNETTKIIATFTENDWNERHGWKTIKYTIKNLDKDMYFRLRGTNVPANTPFETDADGNPLLDTLATQNLGIDGAEEAYADLWFYSNPIFVKAD